MNVSNGAVVGEGVYANPVVVTVNAESASNGMDLHRDSQFCFGPDQRTKQAEKKQAMERRNQRNNVLVNHERTMTTNND